MSWNMRGSCDDDKLHSVRCLVKKYKPLIVGLQETKRCEVGVTTARSLWGSQAYKWIALPANVLSGGLLLMWNTDLLTVHDSIIGRYSLFILCSVAGSSTK